MVVMPNAAGLNGLPLGLLLVMVCGAELFTGNVALLATAVTAPALFALLATAVRFPPSLALVVLACILIFIVLFYL